MPQSGLPNELIAELVKALSGTGEQKIPNPTVVRTGDKIILPDGAYIPDVINALDRQYRNEEQKTKIHVTISVPPWDGAMALKEAIETNIGVFIQEEGFGGAHQIDVEVDFGKTVQVPWGTFQLPGMDGAEISTDTNLEDGRVVFQCHVTCKRRYEARIRRLLDTVRDIATKKSLHKGKAFSISFFDGDGYPIRMPKPRFFEFSQDNPIFRQELTAAIERNIFVPIRYPDAVKNVGEPLKRGILFAGRYGVGKTLLASHIAVVATSQGWTFIYVKEPGELPEALRYAQQYQPAVVFVEDIDRVAGLERTDDVNELLNQLDGIDSKAAEIITILTTNHLDKVNPAMLRPGRIDLVLEVLPPDAETVAVMIKEFAGAMLDENANLEKASQLLAGETPAKVRETVGRSKLESIRRTGSTSRKITAHDLEVVAREIKAESDLLKKPVSQPIRGAKEFAQGLTAAAQVMTEVVGKGNGSYHEEYTVAE